MKIVAFALYLFAIFFGAFVGNKMSNPYLYGFIFGSVATCLFEEAFGKKDK